MPALHDTVQPQWKIFIMFIKNLLGPAAALVIALNAGCAIEPIGKIPAESKALSSAELLDLIERAAAEGKVFDDGYDGGLTFAFRSKGRLEATSRFFSGKTVIGRWWVDAQGSRLCTQIETDPEDCSRVHRLLNQPGRYYLEAEGRTQQANTFAIR